MTRRITYIIIGLAGVVVLAGGAFLAVRLITGDAPMQSIGRTVSVGSAGADGSSITFTLRLVPAPEVPTEKAAAKGLVDSVEDGTFIVRTGNNMVVALDKYGPSGVQTDGPAYQVVITKDTKLYRDITFDTHVPTAGEQIQQLIEPMDAADIAQVDSASVWGSKRGDRLVADFILISRPPMSNRPWVE